ncbi:MAG TPA: hypothetical protein V6D09_11445 [Leptolyngbyaceae cyanobacterium]
MDIAYSKWPILLFISRQLNLADNLSLDAGIGFDRNKKVKFVDVDLAKNAGEENQTACFRQFLMR